MWSMLISLAVYVLAAWGASSFLKNQGLDPGFSKRVLAGCFAFAVSWLVGYGIDALFPSQRLALPPALDQSSLSAPCSGGAPLPPPGALARPITDAPNLSAIAPCAGSPSAAEMQAVEAALRQAMDPAKP